MTDTTAPKISKTSKDYWSVEDADDGYPLGNILGGGPTRGTRYKAITRRWAAADPEAAPARGYASTLREAAEILAR